MVILIANLWEFVNDLLKGSRIILKFFLIKVSDEEMQEHYDNFFEEVFVECEDGYGEIEELNVCDNLGNDIIFF